MADADRRSHLHIVRATLAADCACDEAAFLGDGVTIAPFEPRAGRMRYKPQGPRLAIMSMGVGVVVSCDPEREDQLQADLGQLKRDQVFEAVTVARLSRYVESAGQVMRGPTLRYICAAPDLRPAAPPGGVTLTLHEGAAIAELYRYPGFPNALSSEPTTTTPPDMLAVAARRAGEVIGIAGASADSDALWQIGVDVIPAEQGRGVGQAMVSRLTAEVLSAGRVPFYATAIPNLASSNLALSLGYRPAWAEMHASQPR